MAKARILASWVGEGDDRSAIYHCVSRVVERRFHFGVEEKEKFECTEQTISSYAVVQ